MCGRNEKIMENLSYHKKEVNKMMNDELIYINYMMLYYITNSLIECM